MDRFCRLALVAVPLLAAAPLGAGNAQAQFPIVDEVAQKVIQKYETASCEQLWAQRGQHSEQEKRVIEFLRNDPARRQEFFNRIAGPVMNKMFVCGMVP